MRLKKKSCTCPCKLLGLTKDHGCAKDADELPVITVFLASGSVTISPCTPCRLKNVRVLVTGSRDWEDDERVYQLMDLEYEIIRARYGRVKPIIVQGGARGVDTAAASWAVTRGFMVESHRPDYRKYGRQRAPHIRNALMVSLGANLAVGMVKDDSAGAKSTLEKAKRAGIEVHLHEWEDED